MSAAIKKYCRKVGRYLVCLSKTKKRLLGGLEQELWDLPAKEVNSVSGIEARYGSPQKIARELQETVSVDERSKSLRRRKWEKIIIIAAAIFVVVLVCILADAYADWLWDSHPDYYVITIS